MRTPQLYSPDASVAIASRSHGDGLGLLANDAVRVNRAESTRERIFGVLSTEVVAFSTNCDGVQRCFMAVHVVRCGRGMASSAWPSWVGAHLRRRCKI